MKSQDKEAKRIEKEVKYQEALRSIAEKQRTWNAAKAGDAEALIFMGKKYLCMKDDYNDHKATVAQPVAVNIVFENASKSES